MLKKFYFCDLCKSKRIENDLMGFKYISGTKHNVVADLASCGERFICNSCLDDIARYFGTVKDGQYKIGDR